MLPKRKAAKDEAADSGTDEDATDGDDSTNNDQTSSDADSEEDQENAAEIGRWLRGQGEIPADTEREGELIGGQPKQAPARDRSAERADDAGGVKAGKLRRVQRCRADA